MLYHVLAVGDVVGESGLEHLRRHLRSVKQWKDIAFTVVNGENVSGVGLTPAQANQQLTNAGLNIRITGGAAQNSNAKVTSQDTEAGASVPKGTVVTIECLIQGEDGE